MEWLESMLTGFNPMLGAAAILFFPLVYIGAAAYRDHVHSMSKGIDNED